MPCQNNATCTDLFLGYDCACAAGYNGSVCDEDIDECINAPCLSNNQTCVNSIGGYDCICSVGYSGEWCEEEIDECASDPCNNGVNIACLLMEFNSKLQLVLISVDRITNRTCFK